MMGLSFINRRQSPVSVCLLWYNTGCGANPWRRTGWWNLGIGQGQQVLSGNLRNRYYYFHAEAWDGAVWGDDRWRFLINDNRFDICLDGILEPSYLAPFRELDTGDYTGFTVNLT